MAKRPVVRASHLLFALSLAAMSALGAWWIVFFTYSSALEKKAALNELLLASTVAALTLGRADSPPAVGPVPGSRILEVVPSASKSSGDLFVPLAPRYANLGVRADPALVRDITAKASRRRIQVIGEGSLLFTLLGVCTVMLFVLIQSDRRQMRRMEAFLSTVTHEMKTPLAGIKSMLQTFVAGRVPEDRKGLLYAMGLKETERLEHLVENMLISGRLRSAPYRVEMESVALRPLLDGFVSHRERYLVGRQESITLTWEPNQRDLTVQCDEHALSVVLDNLTDNALKYGGEKPRVVLRVVRREGRVEVAVEDEGIGIDPAQAEELFEPFLRAVDAKAGVHHGTGLGLSISRELVRRMGGELRAESLGPGRGSRFVVALAEGRR